MKKTTPFCVLLLSCTLLLTSCHSNRKLAGTGSVRAVANRVWTYSISHPDGFTMDISTMTEPAEGIVVAYAATQGCHSRKQLGRVVRHAIPPHTALLRRLYGVNKIVSLRDNEERF